jgi:hypothetical protein
MAHEMSQFRALANEHLRRDMEAGIGLKGTLFPCGDCIRHSG